MCIKPAQSVSPIANLPRIANYARSYVGRVALVCTQAAAALCPSRGRDNDLRPYCSSPQGFCLAFSPPPRPCHFGHLGGISLDRCLQFSLAAAADSTVCCPLCAVPASQRTDARLPCCSRTPSPQSYLRPTLSWSTSSSTDTASSLYSFTDPSCARQIAGVKPPFATAQPHYSPPHAVSRSVCAF